MSPLVNVLPLLLRPRILVLKNRFRGRSDLGRLVARDVVVSFFGVTVAAAIFFGTSSCLDYVRGDPTLAALPPSAPLALVFLCLSGMLVLSGSVAAMGAFYAAEDLDLLAAAPVSPPTLFAGRLGSVLFTTSWMPAVFLVPMLLAFDVTYGGGGALVAASPFILLPFFVIPASLGTIAATALSLLIPYAKTRAVRLTVTVLMIGTLGVLLDLVRRRIDAGASSDEILKTVRFLSAPDLYWLPSRQLADALESVLTGRTAEAGLPAACLWLTAGAACAAAYLLVDLVHPAAYSFSRSNRPGRSRRGGDEGRVARLLGRALVGAAGPRAKAVILKEARTTSREMAHVIEFAMLLGLSCLYLYNLRIFSAIDNAPPATRAWWRSLLFVMNLGMNAFVATSLCTRFVFPSVSRDGRGYWVLYSSPLSVREVLAAKFLCWYPPVALAASLLFAAGTTALGLTPAAVAASGALSVVISYGLVGAAVGFGAMFAVFDWEHPYQLAAGFGSFVYMLFATTLVFVNVTLVYVFTFVPVAARLGLSGPAGTWAVTAALVCVLLGLNVGAATWAVRRGERVLSGLLG